MVKKFSVIFALILLFTFTAATPAFAQVTLYTPYTGLSVTPGETIDYTGDVINNDSGIKHDTFDMEGLPKGWSYKLTAGGNAIKQLSVRDEKQLNVEVTVSLEIEQD